MMFGQTRPDGGVITPDHWAAFLHDVITPYFPDGLTVTTVAGQWQDRKTGIIGQEPSKLVWIATRDRPTLSHDLDAIRTAYKARFNQQSVGLILSQGCESF